MTELPEAIRQNLSKFKSHQKNICLSCGFEGPMGDMGTKLPKSKMLPFFGVLFFIMFLFVIFPPGAGAAMVVMIFWMIGINSEKMTSLKCPRCNRVFEVKNKKSIWG